MDLASWFQTPQGKRALKAERRFVARSLVGRVQNLLQIGGPLDHPLFSKALVARRYFLTNTRLVDASVSVMQAEFDALPVRTASLDVVLCAHALETMTNPRELLQEVYRTLKSEGVIVVMGLHRFSLWRLFLRKQTFPQNTQFYSIDRIARKLCQAGFVLERQQTACFRLPSQKKQWLFLEVLGHLLLPFLGGVYMIVAVKRERCVTPLFDNLFPEKMTTSRAE